MNEWKPADSLHSKVLKNCFLGLWFWCIKQSNSDILFFNSMSTFTQKCFSISTYNGPQELSPPKMILYGLKDISSSIRCCFRGLERCFGGKHACWPSLRSCVWIPASTCKGWGKACACNPSAMGRSRAKTGRSQTCWMSGSVRDSASNEKCREQ